MSKTLSGPQTQSDSMPAVAPAQICRMHMLTKLRESIQRIIGNGLDIKFDIAENTRPMPNDYVTLFSEILVESLKFIKWRSRGMLSVGVRISEIAIHSQLTHIVLEVENRGVESIGLSMLNENLLRLRSRTKQWHGFLVIGESSQGKTLLCATLPIVSL